jgi:2-polyprenyl-3-methyl-5-hydroxy-6-metoxy-1,4-benzoquinol methylase
MIAVRCNLCGRDDWRVRFPATFGDAHAPAVEAFRCTSAGYGSHPQIVECRHCGYVYTTPRWSGEELLQAYNAVEDETYRQQRAGREQTFARHLQALERITGPAAGRRLLDVGAYIGVFVDVARRAGWDACGVEPSAWAAAVAQEQGLPVFHGTTASPALAGERYDVVTLWDVIEHLDDPAAELAQTYGLLRPGGFLAVHTMDIDSVVARLLGRRWPWLMDMHLHYFSRRTLAEMLRQKGFEVLWIGPQGRYLTLGYLVTRLAALSRPAGRVARATVDGLGLAGKTIPLNFGDLITAYARRPKV